MLPLWTALPVRTTAIHNLGCVSDFVPVGGGFGLVAPAGFRVATENTRLAMPETKIGYFPGLSFSTALVSPLNIPIQMLVAISISTGLTDT